MSEFSKKISYIKGLAEGMELDSGDKLSGLVLKLIDWATEVAAGVDEMSDAYDELNDYVENIDEDLFKLEENAHDDLDDGDDDYFDFDGGEDENVGAKAELHPFPIQPGEAGAPVVQICPHCHRGYRVDERLFVENVGGKCPHCGEKVFAQDDAEGDSLPLFVPDEKE